MRVVGCCRVVGCWLIRRMLLVCGGDALCDFFFYFFVSSWVL